MATYSTILYFVGHPNQRCTNWLARRSIDAGRMILPRWVLSQTSLCSWLHASTSRVTALQSTAAVIQSGSMSAVWEFYTVKEVDRKLAICITSKSDISHGGTTLKTFGQTNLIRHLKNHHPAEYVKFQEAHNSGAATANVGQIAQPASSPLLSFMSN